MIPLYGTVKAHIRSSVSLSAERIWGVGRILVALGILAGSSLLLRGQPVLAVFTGLMVLVIAYATILLLVLYRAPHRMGAVFLIGFVLDNSVVMAAWWAFLAANSGAMQTNDMYLTLVPILMVGVVRLGWVLGGIYSAVWLGWLVLSSILFYGHGSYDVQQLPVRVIFIGIAVVIAMRLVAITMRERRLERVRLEELERLERFKSSIIQSISHELRTPLTTIKVCSELLTARLGGQGRRELDRVTQSLSRATTRLERMIEQSTDFAKAREDSGPVRVQRVSLERLIRGTVSLQSPELEARQQTVEYQIPQALPEVVADPTMIERVVSILVDNAIKYSNEGGCIRIGAMSRNGTVRVDVADQGPGIPAEDRQYVFSGLYRGSHGDRLASPGAGLSLALARELIERHGGAIGLDTARRGGTTVYFVLPVSLNGGAPAGGPQAGAELRRPDPVQRAAA